MKLAIIIAVFILCMVAFGILVENGILPEWLIAIPVVLFSLGMVYFTFLRGMLRTRRLLQHGLPAEAVILKRFDTGTTINNNPQIGLLLDVRPGTQPPFQAEARVLISRLNPNAFPEGTKVSVRYDPKNKKSVAVESEDTGMAQATAQNMVDAIVEEQNHLAKHGVEAKAVIMRTWDLNINITGEDGVEGRLTGLLVEVSPENGPKFEAEIKASIALKSQNKYVTGTELIVKYDPNDLRKVGIERRVKQENTVN